MKIYVPDKNQFTCFYILNKDTIRAYRTCPQARDMQVSYRDYYINSNYIYTDGVQNFSYYSTIPVFLNYNDITTDYFYRNDLANILIIFAIIFIFAIWVPIRVILRFFKKGVI